MCSEEAEADRAGKSRACRGLRQALHAKRSADADVLAEDPGRKPVKPRYLAGTSRQDDLLAWQVLETGGVETVAQFLENLLDGRAGA